ncbi:DUF945 domain-containing protein [Chitinophaga costaii]|nr:DUF932 domain-containing protein [Chitinophaga costaii]PUZ21655.1 DUF945 domain-containing protein [Chitinophaga costaii]
MADNINYNAMTRQHAFYSKGEKAWHLKGQIPDRYERSEDVCRQAQLNYPVAILPNIHRVPGQPDIFSNQSFFTYREDTNQVLGAHVGPDYTVMQNLEAFDFFDSIAGKDSIYYETAGALGNGERIFITAKLPSYIKVGGVDIIEKYLFLTTSHDGTGSITVAFTPVRIVCNNTLNAALKNCSNVVKIRHTKNAKDKLNEAHRVMGMVNTFSPAIEQQLNAFANVRISDAHVRQLIEHALCPSKEVLTQLKAGERETLSTNFKNQVNKAYEYAMSSPTQQMITTQGNLFGAYNAVTGYFQNVVDYKTQDQKIDSILYGGTAQRKAQTAFQLCEAYALHGAGIFQN